MLIHSTGPPTQLYVIISSQVRGHPEPLSYASMAQHTSTSQLRHRPTHRTTQLFCRFTTCILIHHLLPQLLHIANSVSQLPLYLYALFHPSDFIITTIFHYLVTRYTPTPHMDIFAHHLLHHRYVPRGIHGIFNSVRS